MSSKKGYLFDSLDFERHALDLYGKGTTILDAGCGTGDGWADLKEELARGGTIIGLDMDPESLLKIEVQENTLLVAGDTGILSFKNDVFDLILSRFVFEHLRRPDLVLKEFSRVLKPGGRVMILTYNLLYPINFLSFVLPLPLRKVLWRILGGKKAQDHTFPTYYRCNTMGAFRRRAGKLPLEEDELVMWGILRYGIKSRWVTRLLGAFESLVVPEFMKRFRPRIYVLYKKT